MKPCRQSNCTKIHHFQKKGTGTEHYGGEKMTETSQQVRTNNIADLVSSKYHLFKMFVIISVISIDILRHFTFGTCFILSSQFQRSPTHMQTLRNSLNT